MLRGNGKAGPPGCKSRQRERKVKVDYKTKVRHRTGSGLTGTRESRSNGKSARNSEMDLPLEASSVVGVLSLHQL